MLGIGKFARPIIANQTCRWSVVTALGGRSFWAGRANGAILALPILLAHHEPSSTFTIFCRTHAAGRQERLCAHVGDFLFFLRGMRSSDVREWHTLLPVLSGWVKKTGYIAFPVLPSHIDCTTPPLYSVRAFNKSGLMGPFRRK